MSEPLRCARCKLPIEQTDVGFRSIVERHSGFTTGYYACYVEDEDKDKEFDEWHVPDYSQLAI